MRPDLSELTDLHLLILGALWTLKKATIAQVHEAIADEADVTTKTIATLLGRLEKRGLVIREAGGREGVYRAAVTRRAVLVARVGATLSAVFAAEDGAVGAAAVRGKHTREGDAEKLIELLRRAEKDLKSK